MALSSPWTLCMKVMKILESYCCHHVLFWPQVNEGDEIDITKSKDNSVVELSRFKVLTINKNHTKKNKRRLSGVRFARIFMPREEFDEKYKSSDWKVLHGLQHRLTVRQRGKGWQSGKESLFLKVEWNTEREQCLKKVENISLNQMLSNELVYTT